MIPAYAIPDAIVFFGPQVRPWVNTLLGNLSHTDSPSDPLYPISLDPCQEAAVAALACNRLGELSGGER